MIAYYYNGIHFWSIISIQLNSPPSDCGVPNQSDFVFCDLIFGSWVVDFIKGKQSYANVCIVSTTINTLLTQVQPNSLILQCFYM